jgi:DNA-binding transcriptional MerR regulator
MTAVGIPNRSLFKAPEVCQIVGVQPYVLRSWEAEFPDLGVARKDGATRVYRRSDVERVLQIKQLVFVEGLTLSGARRRLAEHARPPETDELPIDELFGRDARERLVHVRDTLREVMQLLSREPHHAGNGGQAVEATVTSARRRQAERPAPAERGQKPARRAR